MSVSKWTIKIDIDKHTRKYKIWNENIRLKMRMTPIELLEFLKAF